MRQSAVLDAKLVVVEGNANKREIALKLPMTIGRNREAGLTISHPNVSRIHCQLYELDGALVVRDNKSTNGTLINDQSVFEEIIKPGDKLSVGPLTFVALYTPPGAFPQIGEATEVVDEIDEGDEGDDSLRESTQERSYEEIQNDLAQLSAEFGELEDFDGHDEASSEIEASPENEASPESQDDPAEGRSFAEIQSDLADLIGEEDEDEEESPDSSEAESAEAGQFNFTIELAAAGDVPVGAAVRLMGEDIGSVSELRFIDDEEGALNAQAELTVADHITSMLRDDLQVEIRRDETSPYLEIVSLGVSGELVSPGQVVAKKSDEHLLDARDDLGPETEEERLRRGDTGGSSMARVQQTFSELISDVPDSENFDNMADDLLSDLSAGSNAAALDEADFDDEVPGENTEPGVLSGGDEPDDVEAINAAEATNAADEDDDDSENLLAQQDQEEPRPPGDVNDWLEAFAADMGDDDSVSESNSDASPEE